MIELIYGLSGSGKSSLVYERIKEDLKNGKRAYLIVPEQHTVETERNMLKMLPPSAQLHFEVLNFTRLANKIFRIYGGLSYNYITPEMKSLIMWKTLRELAPMTLEYKNITSSGDVAIASVMLGTVSEFKACGIKPHEIERLAEKLGQDLPLGRKLYDISLIYSAYSAAVSASFDDASDDLSKVSDILSNNNFFASSNVYIDSFTSYTAQEHKIINRIFAQADNTTVTIMADSPSTRALHTLTVKETSDKLRAAAGDGARITVLDKLFRFNSPELERIGRHLWDIGGSATGEEIPPENQGAVELVCCENPYNEAEAVANTVKKLVMEGYRYRDIAIIARDAETYRGIIDAELEKADIPFFMSEKTDLMTKPLISMLLACFKILGRNWQTEDVTEYLKTGMCGFSDNDIDNFEAYTITWNVSGRSNYSGNDWQMNADGYTREESARGTAVRTSANNVRRGLFAQLNGYFKALECSQSVAEKCLATLDFLKAVNVSETLKRHADKALAMGDKKEADELSKTLKTVVKALSDISSAIGEDDMSIDEFASALKIVFKSTQIGTIPTGIDEVVVGSASMLRATGIRCAIIMGLCEGEFPASASDRSILSDKDRKALEELGVTVSGNSEERSSEELLFAYRAMTMPSDKLILMYHTGTLRNGASSPSLAFRRVAELLPHSRVKLYESDIRDRLYSKERSFELLRSANNSTDTTAIAAALSQFPEYEKKINRKYIPVCSPECHLSNEVSDSAFGKNLYLTQSRMDMFVKCHFNYFSTYVLKLRDMKKSEFGFGGMGTFVHRALELYMKDINENGKNDGQIEQVLFKITNEFNSDTEHEKNKKGSLKHMCDSLCKLADLTMNNLSEELGKSKFVPRLFEFKLGSGSNDMCPTLELEDGSTVSIAGIVDRVDTFKMGNDVYVKVSDYKTGDKSFSMSELRRGFDTQLLLYLFALCNVTSKHVRELLGCEEGDTLKPAGAVYISTAIKELKKESSQTTEDVKKEASKSIKRSGLLTDNKDVLLAMNSDLDPRMISGIRMGKDGNLRGKAAVSSENFDLIETELNNIIKGIACEIKSGNATAEPTPTGNRYPCEYCEMKQFCRVDLTKGRTEDDPDYV